MINLWMLILILVALILGLIGYIYFLAANGSVIAGAVLGGTAVLLILTFGKLLDIPMVMLNHFAERQRSKDDTKEDLALMRLAMTNQRQLFDAQHSLNRLTPGGEDNSGATVEIVEGLWGEAPRASEVIVEQ